VSGGGKVQHAFLFLSEILRRKYEGIARTGIGGGGGEVRIWPEKSKNILEKSSYNERGYFNLFQLSFNARAYRHNRVKF
jgi:hypothetical protein